MQCAESFLIWHDKKTLEFCSVQPVEAQKLSLLKIMLKWSYASKLMRVIKKTMLF